jgi:hypothetical protein
VIGRVAVAEAEDDHPATVLGTGLRHSVQLRVGDLASRQEQIGLTLLGDRANDIP